MWWYLLVLSCLQLQAKTSTAQPLPGVWGLTPPRPDITDDSGAENSLAYRMQRFRLLNAPISDSSSSVEDDSAPLPAISALQDTPSDYFIPETKRAFTLLSRWHPFSTLSRNAPSIREQNRQILNDLDIETRAMMRPVGQPLRWG